MKHNGIPHSEYPYNIQVLFFKRFSCRVPSIALKSTTDIRNRGVYAVGESEEETMNAHHEYIETSLTINRLFNIWSNGYGIRIINHTDCVDIFNAITNHLQQWVGYLNHGIQVPDAPFEDLIALDNFADVVYVHARHERSKRNLNYFADLFKNNDLGFNLNPTTQFGQSLTFIPLGQSDGTNIFYNSDDYKTEERQSFSSELERLGGRMSPGVREMERASIFSGVDFNKK